MGHLRMAGCYAGRWAPSTRNLFRFLGSPLALISHELTPYPHGALSERPQAHYNERIYSCIIALSGTSSMPPHLRTFSLPILVLLAALAFSVSMAYRYPPTPAPNIAAAITSTTPTKNYYDGTYLFGFDYPADATVQHLSDNDGNDVILLTRPGQGVEVHITPSDRDALTESDIREEAGPSLVSGPTRSLLTTGIPLLRADLSFATFGRVHNAWFIRRGYQYQLIAGTNAASLLDDVLTTWCFHDAPLYPGQHCVGYPLP
jgi:hypothetical protein